MWVKMSLRLLQQGNSMRTDPSVGADNEIAHRFEYEQCSQTPAASTVKSQRKRGRPDLMKDYLHGSTEFVDALRNCDQVHLVYRGLGGGDATEIVLQLL
jgi:hypothetical protein